jgi:hypothetical protein
MREKVERLLRAGFDAIGQSTTAIEWTIPKDSDEAVIVNAGSFSISSCIGGGGPFVVEVAVDVPGTRDDPPDVDICEISRHPHVNAAITAMLEAFAKKEIENALIASDEVAEYEDA